jgi:hypothetical protein
VTWRATTQHCPIADDLNDPPIVDVGQHRAERPFVGCDMTGGGRIRPIDGREPRPVSSAELREKLLPFRLRDFTPACPTPSRDAADTENLSG